VRAYYSATRFVVRSAIAPLTRWEVRGSENVPREGGVVVASNHISFWDPPIVGVALPREAHFLAKEELFATPLLGWLIRTYNAIPIRRGVSDLSGIARAVEALKRGAVLILFPEGTRMRDGQLHPARPGVGMMAVAADVPIVPCYVSGSNHPGRWLLRQARVRIWFGPARSWKELAGPLEDHTPGRALYQRVGQGVMREIAVLRSEQQESASRGAA
jgi:1-acyl-sn-glycerol-3-phosphate acyltransferase